MNHKANLLYHFQIWNPFLVEQMRNCSHHYSQRSLNPFHIEGDCFSHTMMVLNNIDTSYLPLASAFVALTHDTGKVLTRNPTKPSRVSFFSHGYSSVQYAIDFVKYLIHVNYIDHKMAEDVLRITLPVISHHMELYDENTSIDKMKELCNNDYDTCYIAYVLGFADMQGSFGYRDFDEGKIFKFNQFFSDFRDLPQEEKQENPDIIVWAGVPASGKDTFAKYLSSSFVFSYDNTRIQAYLQEYPEAMKELDNENLYQEAFRYCNNKKIDLNKRLMEEIESVILAAQSPISICNTNCTKKLRRSLLNTVINRFEKNYERKPVIHCNLVCCDYEEAVKSDEERSDKYVGEGIVRKFATNIQVPTVHEGFDKVNFVLRR